MQYKTLLSMLALSTSLTLGLSACDTVIDPSVMPSGYTTNVENQRSLFDFPPGYRYSRAYNERYDKSNRAADDAKSHLVIDDVDATQLSWSQIGLDLAIAIDNDIGLETQKLALHVAGNDDDMVLSLDYYLRQNLVDLAYEVTPHHRSSEEYHVKVNVTPLEDRHAFKRVAPSTDILNPDEDQLNEGGKTAVYTFEPDTFQDIQVETIVMKGDKVISQTRSAHRLSLELAQQ